MPKPHRKNDVLVYLTPRQTKTVLLNMRHLASESVSADYRRSSKAIVQRIEAALFRAERIRKQAQRSSIRRASSEGSLMSDKKDKAPERIWIVSQGNGNWLSRWFYAPLSKPLSTETLYEYTRAHLAQSVGELTVEQVRCDYRNAECAATGVEISGIWVCDNHKQIVVSYPNCVLCGKPMSPRCLDCED